MDESTLAELDGTVRARVEHDFAPKDWEAIADLLRGIQDVGPRVHRAVLALAEGDIDKLLHFARVAQIDWRDVIYWAETPRQPGEMTEDEAKKLSEQPSN